MTQRKKPQTIEYAFRFARGTNTERARMVEMIRVNLGELLKMVTLTHAGQAVQVDGFHLRDAPSVTYDLNQPVPQDAEQPA
jgi:diacylglycerol kinase family enzyme